MRDMEYGYSTSVYSTPSSNFGGNKSNFGNGVGSGNAVPRDGGGSVPSNTVIVANVCMRPELMNIVELYYFLIQNLNRSIRQQYSRRLLILKIPDKFICYYIMVCKINVTVFTVTSVVYLANAKDKVS